MDEQITMPKLTAQILFDALASSMDFGSGFLDTEGVEALRDLAVLIGVDPAKATPDTFVKYYPHPFKPMDDLRTVDRVFGIYDNSEIVDHIRGPGYTRKRNEERRPDFVPCLAGAYPHCQKPESDPIHKAAEDERLSA